MWLKPNLTLIMRKYLPSCFCYLTLYRRDRLPSTLLQYSYSYQNVGPGSIHIDFALFVSD